MRTVAVALALMIVGLSGTATAGKVEAKEAYGRASRYFRLNDFQHALETFKEAYLDYPEPSLLYNIGQCQRQLGQDREAIASYKSFLHEQPQATNRAEVETQIEGLQHRVDEEDARKAAEQHAAAIAAPVPAPVSAPVVVVATHEPERRPLYKKWWLWTAVGVGVVAIGLGVGLGLGLRPAAYPGSLPGVMTVKF